MDILAYLFTSDGLDEEWFQIVERLGPNYAKWGFENGSTGRRLVVGRRVGSTVSAAEAPFAKTYDHFAGGTAVDRTIGSATYEFYPGVFETGVLFGGGVSVGFVAVAGNDPPLEKGLTRGEDLHANSPWWQCPGVRTYWREGQQVMLVAVARASDSLMAPATVYLVSEQVHEMAVESPNVVNVALWPLMVIDSPLGA